MRVVVAVVLLFAASTTHAALVNTQPSGSGWLRLNLPPSPYPWSGWVTKSNPIVQVPALQTAAGYTLWTDAPLVTLWHFPFHTDIPRHDFTPEFAAGLSEVTVTFGRERARHVIDELGESWSDQDVTYTGAGGYSRTATLRAFFIPEPGAVGMMVWACAAIGRRRTIAACLRMRIATFRRSGR